MEAMAATLNQVVAELQALKANSSRPQQQEDQMEEDEPDDGEDTGPEANWADVLKEAR